MPTDLDFLRAKLLAYKQTLDGKRPGNKDCDVSITIADQFNAIVEAIGRASPAAAPHLPKPITSKIAPFAGVSDVRFLDLEMMINEAIAVLDVIRAGR
jgi:hypothetical protein